MLNSNHYVFSLVSAADNGAGVEEVGGYCQVNSWWDVLSSWKVCD